MRLLPPTVPAQVSVENKTFAKKDPRCALFKWCQFLTAYLRHSQEVFPHLVHATQTVFHHTQKTSEQAVLSQDLTVISHPSWLNSA